VIDSGLFQERRRPRLRLVLNFLVRWPIFSILVLGFLLICTVIGPYIAPYDYEEANLFMVLEPPVGFGGSWNHPLGTDVIGRDVLSRLMAGGRISMMLVIVSMFTGTTIGCSLGMISGYYGGAIDEILMRLMDIWYGIPFLMLAMMLVVALGPGIDTMLVIMALASFAGFVRVVRAEVLSLKQMDYVALARVSGASTLRIMFKHILPGTFSTVLVVATLQTGGLILAEAFLSYIGAGIPPPYPAWGVMIADGRNYLHSTWWVAIIPGVAILMTVMALNFLGDWMRDRLDPRLRQIA